MMMMTMMKMMMMVILVYMIWGTAIIRQHKYCQDSDFDTLTVMSTNIAKTMSTNIAKILIWGMVTKKKGSNSDYGD